MAYTVPTLAEAATALASRLNDPLNIRWELPELYGYIREALRTWSAWTACFRDQGSFTTTIGEAFYDLPTVIPDQREQTLTNWDLVADVQAALLEPQAPAGTWTGTDQFSLEQLSIAIQRRRDQFLRETGAVLTRSVMNYPTPAATGRIDLAENIAIIRRAAWRSTATMILYPLLVTDEWAGAAYARQWSLSTLPPFAYSVSVVPPLTLQIIPPPPGDGDLDLVSINTGTVIDPTVESVLGVPNDFAWVIKYGALADLLQGDGLALDPQRAAYCEQRWRQGLEQARESPVVLNAMIGDPTLASPPPPIPCQTASLSEADRYSPVWQLVPGIPQTVLLAGQTLIALWPPPGGIADWTITLDVVENAPALADPTDVIPVSQDVYDTLLDLAQHTALFKEGPGQLELATALFDRCARAAGISLRLQQASQPDRAALTQQQSRDRQAVAEQRAPVLQGVEND